MQRRAGGGQTSEDERILECEGGGARRETECVCIRVPEREQSGEGRAVGGDGGGGGGDGAGDGGRGEDGREHGVAECGGDPGRPAWAGAEVAEVERRDGVWRRGDGRRWRRCGARG